MPRRNLSVGAAQMTEEIESTEKSIKTKKRGWLSFLGLSKVVRMMVVGTLTSLLAAGLIGYLGLIGALPVVQRYMEDLPVTQQLLDAVQSTRVKPMLAGKFNVLVADLDGDHSDGRNAAHVVNTLSDQFDVASENSPIRVQRTFRILRLPPAPDTATATRLVIEKGRKQLTRFNADLIVWGEVARGLSNKTVLRLRFLGRAANQKSQKGNYALGQTLELPADFGSDLGTSLVAQVIADAAPAKRAGRHVVPLLEPVLQRLRSLAQRMPANLTPEQRGGILTSYASVAEVLGDQNGNRALFQEAFDAYRSALKEWPRDKNPTQWAEIQQDLSEALGRLGRIETGTDLMEQSVSAQRSVLEVFTREKEPTKWAHAQHTLCIALRRLALRVPGTAHARESLDACRAALKVIKQEREPITWAFVQGNLGASLVLLGRREPGTAKLHEAVLALRSALQKISRTQEPLAWARGQHDIAITVMEIGLRESSQTHLDEAIDLLYNCLEELTYEKVPTYWAQARVSLAIALREAGLKEYSNQRLNEAVNVLQATLKVATREMSPEIWASAKERLAMTLMDLGYREQAPNQQTRFDEAFKVREELLLATEIDETKKTGRPGQQTGNALVAVAWCAIHARKFDRALTTSHRAVELLQSEQLQNVTKAHSLMFSGQTAEAKALYLSEQPKIYSNGMGMRAVILDHFRVFRNIGLTDALMADIEEEFGSNAATTNSTSPQNN